MSFTPNGANGAPGAAIPSQATLIGGSDGTDLRSLATDASGRAKVLLYDASGNAISSTGGALNAASYVADSGDVLRTAKRPTRVVRNLISGAIPSAAVVLFSGAPGYYVAAIQVKATYQTAANVATNLIFFFYDTIGGTTNGAIWDSTIFLGTSPPSPTLAFVSDSTPAGFFYLSPNSGSSLSLVVGNSANASTLVSGEIDIWVYYGLTSDLS